MTTQQYKRPSGNYVGEAGLPNRTKYFDDSNASPRRPISSTKVDGDINYLIDAVNQIYDTAVSGIVADGSVTNAKIRDSAGCSVIGRATATTGVVADITAAANDTVLVRKSNVVQFSTIPAGAIDNDAVTTSTIANTNVTFAKIQNVNAGVLLGRTTAGAGSVEALTVGSNITATGGTVNVADASESAKGVVELATAAEQATGTDTARVVPVSGMPMTLISTQTATSSASLVFTDLNSTYGMYEFVLRDIKPATDDVSLRIEMSTNNGSSYLASGYQYQVQAAIAGTGIASEGSASASIILLTKAGGGSAGVGNATGESYSGIVRLFLPSGSQAKKIEASGTYYNAAGTMVSSPVGGANNTTTAVDAVRFTFSSGNIASGSIACYGRR